MRERIRMVQGIFEIQYSEGKGTTITVWIPFSQRHNPDFNIAVSIQRLSPFTASA